MARDERTKTRFQYRERSPEQARKRATQTGGIYDSYTDPRFDVFKPVDGDNDLRILPPTHENAEHFGIDVWLHNNVGADNQVYLCKRRMNDEQCVICDKADEARQHGDEDFANELKPSRRVLMWVIDRNKESEGPKLYAAPWTIDRDVVARSINKRTGETLLIDHPEDGYDVSFQKQGKGLQTKYVAIDIARKPTPLSDNEKQMATWLQLIEDNPLTSVLNYYDDEHLEKQLMGRSTRNKDRDTDTRGKRKPVEDDEDDAPPAKRKPPVDDDDAPPPKKAKRPPIDDPDEDLDTPPAKRKTPVDDEDDNDEPSAKSRSFDAGNGAKQADSKPNRRPADDDDEDDDEPVKPKKKTAPVDDDSDDEDDEPVKPVKKKAVVADDDDD